MSVMPPLPKVAPVPNEYAAAQSLLPIADALARECFSDVRDRKTTHESDPETGERWIELRITVSGTPAEIADAFDRYVGGWVTAAPWPQHNLVRLSYAIA